MSPRCPLVRGHHYLPHHLEFVGVPWAVEHEGVAMWMLLTPALRHHMLKRPRRKSDVQAPIMWWVYVGELRITLERRWGALSVLQVQMESSSSGDRHLAGPDCYSGQPLGTS